MSMRRQIKKLIDSIVQTKDCPHRMARGVAVGMLVGWTPTVGIQMAIAAICAWIVRGNKLAAIGMVWISNPYTMIPIYWFNYEIGYFLVGGARMDKDRFINIFFPAEPMSWWQRTVHAWDQLLLIMGPIFVGSIVVGIPLAMLCYVLTLRAVFRYRARQCEHEVKSEMVVIDGKEKLLDDARVPDEHYEDSRTSRPDSLISADSSGSLQITPKASTTNDVA